MKCRTQAALAVGAGYLLGRTHKTKLALGLAAVAATGKFGGVSGQLIKRGTKLLGSTDALGKLSPQLTEVTDVIRNDLVDAGKAAALTAVRGRIDRLSDRIQDQADTLREGGDLLGAGGLLGGDDGDDGDERPRRRRRGDDGEERPRRRGGDAARRRRRDEEEPAGDEDAEDFDEPADEDEPVRGEDEEPEPDEEAEPDEEPEPARGEDDEPEPEEDRPVRRRRAPATSGTRRARSAAGSAPVRRARR